MDRKHGSELTPVQVIEWCKTFWNDREWRNEQLRMCGPDVGHLLRGVADMLDEYAFKCPECEMPIHNCVCCHEDL